MLGRVARRWRRTRRPAFDSRWNPYLGCWQIVQEQLGDQSVPVAPGTMVCVRPSGRFGVAITTTVDGKNVLEQTIVGDGTAQPLSQADCQGTQTSEWSRDGERLFTRVELECAGRPKRVVSGITQMAKGSGSTRRPRSIDGDHDVRLRRYRRTSDQFTGLRPLPATSRRSMSVEDVIEASSKVLSPALEAALVEAGGRFTLNSRTLTQLADAGVSPNVIDLMVAQAYPDRFRVERPPTYPPASAYSGYSGGNASSGSSSAIAGSASYPYPMYDPMYDPFYSSYYYYSPFAYPYYWGAGYYPYRYNYGYGYRNYYNNYYYGPGTVYAPGNGDSGVSAQPGSPNSRGGDGIVVNGRGYTRVRPSSGSSESGDSATPAQRTPSGRGTRSVNSGSDASSSGSSSGSSGGSVSGGGVGRRLRRRKDGSAAVSSDQKYEPEETRNTKDTKRMFRSFVIFVILASDPYSVAPSFRSSSTVGRMRHLAHDRGVLTVVSDGRGRNRGATAADAGCCGHQRSQRRQSALVLDAELRAAVGQQLHDGVEPLAGRRMQRRVARLVDGVHVGAKLESGPHSLQHALSGSTFPPSMHVDAAPRRVAAGSRASRHHQRRRSVPHRQRRVSAARRPAPA